MRSKWAKGTDMRLHAAFREGVRWAVVSERGFNASASSRGPWVLLFGVLPLSFGELTS